MLLTISAVFYAALAGATFQRFLAIFDLIESPVSRAKWLAVSVVASLLWPMTWGFWAVCAYLAAKDARH